MSIRFIPYREIDKNRWDECVTKSENGLIYSMSSYLDHMAMNWDSVVFDDYTAIMPLTWKKKFTVRYLYQPPFIQQSGIISPYPVDENLVAEMLNIAIKQFSFAEITLNYKNPISSLVADQVSLRNNYILHMSDSSLQKLDEYVIKRNRRAEKNELAYSVSEDIGQAVKLYRELYHNRLPGFSENDFMNFINYCESNTEKVFIRNVYDRTNTLAAVALLLKDDKRIYNIVSCITPQGKTFLANYFLYYKLIEEFAGSGLILDFEGSDIPGIAYFYNKFADENQAYPFIKVNRLPAPFKFLKK